jgi:hypothetical protein
VQLRAFESILIFFSEEEIEKLQADIDKRRSRSLAREGEDRPESVEQSRSIHPTSQKKRRST